MRTTHYSRSLASVVVMAMLALVLPLAGNAFAATLPTLDVEPEITTANQLDQVTLTATLSSPAPQDMNIDWENEGGANDPGDEPGSGAAGATRTAPDATCDINQGAISCTITYTVSNVGNDTWRAWVDLDHQMDPLGIQDLGDATDDSDRTEGRDENATPGAGSENPAGDDCEAAPPTEPDCTDVVLVTTGALEVVPDVQTVDAGSTARLTARLFAPVRQADGKNIDFENENGGNDPDASNTPTTPDATCDIPVGAKECFIEYQVRTGSDQWRVWIDRDKVQSTVEADTAEGRWAGSSDCAQPEDQGTACTPGFPANQSPTPGNGCEFNQAEGDTPSRTEPDCTDVVSVSSRSGPVAQIDCDDASGDQDQDTERETNPSRPADTRTGDPSTERYKCEAFDQFGGRINGVVIKGENENGVNDPDPTDGASHSSPDYQCTTDANVDDPPLLEDDGVCFIEVKQDERELGTAEICFWAGTASEGQALCADEPTGENQVANGTDAPNDLADQVEKTWENPATFRLDCDPETDTNPAGTSHTITCVATSSSGTPVTGVEVDAEATGANDPDTSNTAITPDFTCETGEGGACSFTHEDTGSEGVTVYRAWIDADRSDTTTEADTAEGRDETITPGTRAEPDNTDVVEKTWGPPPATVVMTPEADTAQVGECNPYTITVTDEEGNPVPNAILDVEQRHERADNQTANDEPTVSFCEPPASGGPNPSDVDESKGDLGSTDEKPDNQGTAGGETTEPTDQNGKVTIGIQVAPGNGSNGTGGVTITAWFETDDNDDPAAAEPKDTSTKSWTPADGEPGVPAGLSLTPTESTDNVNDQVTYTATVSDVNGDPVEGATVTWSEDGEGDFVSQDTTTDANGQAQAVVSSGTEGTQTITATADDCAEGATCTDSSIQTWDEEFCPGHRDDSRNQVVGTSGADVLEGTSGDDVICGLGGNDTINGRGGKDLLLGGGGSDTIKGHGANDTASGGSGKDLIVGNGGSDTLRGKGGNDRLKGSKGNDKLIGGGGSDRMDGGAGRDSCKGGPGRDTSIRCE